MRHVRRPLLLLGLGAVLAACADAPTDPGVDPPPDPPRTLGLVEVTFNQVGTPQMSAVVRPVGRGSLAGGPQAVPATLSGIQLGLRTTATVDHAGERYLQAVFQVRNATAGGTANGTVLRNVTFVPVSTSASVGGTPIKTLRKQDGTDADPAIAAQFRPTGAVADNGGSGLASQYPDVLQAFTEADVSGIDLSAFPEVVNRFPYGFVTRRVGSDATRELPANPAAGQFDGVVTFAFRFPTQAVAGDNPFTVSVQFVVVEDDVTRVTQSVEEQGAGQAAFEARAASLGATQVMLLPGGAYSGSIAARSVCSLRVSGTSGSPTTVLGDGSDVLAVGEATVLAGATAQSFCVDGGAAGAEFTLTPVNLSQAGATSLTLTGSGITGVTGPPTPVAPMTGLSPLRSAGAGDAFDSEFHLALRRWEKTALEPLMRSPAARVQRRGAADGPRRLIVPGVPSVGDLWSLNVASGCSGTPDLRGARVVSIGTRIVIVADTLNPVGGFTTAQYDSIAAEFDSLAWGVNVDNFGAPTDLDGNGRVVAFYTGAVNELSPPASSVIVGGYVNARDLYSSAPGSCTLSNEGEIFYMMVPDPTGAINSNVRTVSSVRGGTVRTLAHEFQHLINAARRIYVNGAPGFEEVWLNEGLSHMAEELMFYRTSFGLAPRMNVNLTNLTSGTFASRRVAAFNSYQNANYGRLRSWMQRPDTTGAFRNVDNLATRGVTWAFLRYAADRRNATDADLWFALVNSTTSGTANLQAALGVDPNTWLDDFVMSMYTDDAVAGVLAEHTNSSWNYRSVYGGLGGFPLGTRPLTDNTPLTLSYAAGGGATYARFGVPANTSANFGITSGGAAPPATTAFVLMRTR